MDKNALTPHYTWGIYDSSKLQKYELCPRMFFWEYILGWRIAGANKDLIFGEAWHRAMEHILLNGYNVDAVLQGAKIGEEYYRRFIPASRDADYIPKTPGNLAIALAQYIRNYAYDTFQVLHTEISGAVEVGDNKLLWFRMDSIMQDPLYQGLITSLEHKTGSRKGCFEPYTVSIQNGTYTYALRCTYDPKDIYGMIVNGTIFYKSQDAIFQRLPAPMSEIDMKEWFWTVNHIIDRLEWDMAELNESSDMEDIMPCFSKRTGSCHKWGQCKYYDFCHNWANPLQHLEYIPDGYMIEWWDPSKRDAKVHFKDGKMVAVEPTEEPPEVPDNVRIEDNIEVEVTKAPNAMADVDMLNRLMNKTK